VKDTGGAVVAEWRRRSDGARFKEVWTSGTHVLGVSGKGYAGAQVERFDPETGKIRERFVVKRGNFPDGSWRSREEVTFEG